MKKVQYILGLVLIAALLISTSAQAQKKWSPQAKGTVIGAGAGALGGALINKRNRAVGGVVGGVVGGAAGYAIGKHTDNKRKEAARVAAANRAEAARAAANREAANRAAIARVEENTGRRPAPAYAAYAAGTPATSTATSNSFTAASPAVLNATYLPNESYGDPSKPYGTSEVRRKSW